MNCFQIMKIFTRHWKSGEKALKDYDLKMNGNI